MKNYFLIAIFFMLTSKMFAQKQAFYLFYKNTPAKEVLSDLEDRFGVSFSYKSILLEKKKITYQKKAGLIEILSFISKKLNVKFVQIENSDFYIVLQKDEENIKEIQTINEVIIKAYLTRGIQKKRNGSYTVTPEKLGILSGLAEPDVLLSFQQLPGVISLDESATNISVRGGAYDQNSVYWNGIRIYQGGHLFGMISPFNPYNIKKVNFYNKNIPSNFEGGISSVIELKGSRKIEKKLHCEAGLNAISADILLSMPILEDKLSIKVSGRSSYRNIFNTSTMKAVEDKVFKNTNVDYANITVNDFNFNDYSIQLNSKILKKHKLFISYIHIKNNLDFNHQINTLTDNYYNNDLKINTDGISISAISKVNNKISLNNEYSLSWYDLLFKDYTYSENTKISSIDKENFVSDMHFYTDLSYNINNSNHLKAGYQYIQKRNAYLFKLFVNNQDYLFDYFKNTINSHSIYGNYFLKHKFINLDIGLRLQYLKELHKYFVEPRFMLSKKLFSKLNIQLSGQILHQHIFQQDKSVIGLLNLGNKVWNISNNHELPVMSSYQTTMALIYKRKNLIFEVNIFRKLLENINFSFPYRVYNKYNYFVGKENIRGLEVYAKKNFGKISGWISYSLMKSDYKFKELKDNNYFTSDMEIKNNFTATVLYEIKNFNIAAGWIWHSPRVYYDDIIKEQNNDSNIQQYVNNNFNIKKLKPYNSINISSSYDFKFSKNSKHKFKLGLSVINLLNNNNLLSVEKNSYGLGSDLQNFYKYGFNRTFNFSLLWKY